MSTSLTGPMFAVTVLHPKMDLAYGFSAWMDSLPESNLCVTLAQPVSEQLRTQSTGKASGTQKCSRLRAFAPAQRPAGYAVTRASFTVIPISSESSPHAQSNGMTNGRICLSKPTITSLPIITVGSDYDIAKNSNSDFAAPATIFVNSPMASITSSSTVSFSLPSSTPVALRATLLLRLNTTVRDPFR